MLFSRRKQLVELAEREAKGESFWTSSFGEPERAKLVLAFQEQTQGWIHDCAEIARKLILNDEGQFFLVDRLTNGTKDLLDYAMSCPDDEVPTVIEAMVRGIREVSRSHMLLGLSERFESRIREILQEHRLSFDLIDDEMVPFSSRTLHVKVMQPALQLLAGRPDLERVERAFHAALEEISKGDAGDSVTDAGTALQEMLISLGCEGNALGPLIKSAKARGMIASHDSPLLDSIEKGLHWVSAERSKTGDAHSVSSAPIEDAWLTVYIVGAFIVRLAAPGLRGRS